MHKSTLPVQTLLISGQLARRVLKFRSFRGLDYPQPPHFSSSSMAWGNYVSVTVLSPYPGTNLSPMPRPKVRVLFLDFKAIQIESPGTPRPTIVLRGCPPRLLKGSGNPSTDDSPGV
eukprot:3328924-Rhodomonas_salina.3